MIRPFYRLAAVVGACLFALAASAATLLPPGEQTFLDANGRPLNGGTVQFYVPGTTSAKDTWQDAGQTILNTNPVVLDTAGRAVIYGTGSYREVVRDGAGNLIWDQVTGDPAAGNASWGGMSGGTPNGQTIAAANFSSGDGQTISFIPTNTNTGAMSLNPNGQGPIGILKDTPAGPFGLTGGEVVANTVVTVTYDASRGAFHLQGSTSQPGTVTTIAGGTTTDLGTVVSHFASITGTAAISSFGSSCSRSSPIYYAIFTDASTVSYVSGSNVTPGRADISTASGDSMILDCLGSGNWRVLAYFPVAGIVPPKAVMAFNANNCPAGWAAADGTGGTADLRGQFVRGLDAGANVVRSGSTTYAVTFGGANFGSETRPKNVALLYCQKL